MNPADRARAAHAAAEAAREAGADPRDVAALRAAASLWEPSKAIPVQSEGDYLYNTGRHTWDRG
jgi:hypothetical protein